jgi:predicted MFS family arabinose efflux permease
LLFGSGTALAGAVSEIWHLYALYGGIAAAGMGAVWSPLVSVVSRWFEARRGLAIGIATLGGGSGVFLVAPLAELLIAQLGWREAYLWLGVISGGLIVVSALFLIRDPREKGLLPFGAKTRMTSVRSAVSSAAMTGIGQIARDRLFWLMALTLGLWWFAGAIIYVHIAPFMLEKGLNASAAALVVTLFGAGNCVGRIGMGAVCDRIGALPTYRLGIGLSAVLMSAFALVDGMTSLYALSFIMGAFVGGSSTQISTVSVALFGTASAGSLMGAVLALVGVVGAGGPVVSGMIFDATQSYAPAFQLGAAVFLLSLVLSFSLRR